MFLGAFGYASTSSAANFACASGDVSCLVSAIHTANGNGQANTITLAAGNYILTGVDNITDGANGLPSITGVLTIVGAGSDATFIQQDSGANPQFRLMHVGATGNLTLQRLTLRGCCRPGFSGLQVDGAGLFNAGTVSIENFAVTGNFTRAGRGGGIFNAGLMTITKSMISGNTTLSGLGGGIANVGALSISDSVITGNDGGDGQAFLFHFKSAGGIENFGTLTITNSNISRNTVRVGGGGISNVAGNVMIINCTITENHAPPGDGGAGGVDNSGGTLTIANSIVKGNLAAQFGGGVWNRSGTTTIISTTFTENQAFQGGGAIANGGTTNVLNSTLSGNFAFNQIGQGGCCGPGGISNLSGSVTLQNTIIARNTTSSTAFDCDGVTSLGNNLIGTTSGCTVTLQPSDLTGDPGLDAFSDNGTPGNGHFPLLPTSRAIGAANDGACPPVDQLGQPRIGHCDIGAIEFALRVTIDIRPGADPTASINPKSNGVIPVAVLTTETFDATVIDPATVRFGKTGTEAGSVQSALSDVNKDGRLDMVLHFHTQATGIACGDTSAVLMGSTFSDLPFVGQDAIVTVGCKK
jgi:hypothetical protein